MEVRQQFSELDFKTAQGCWAEGLRHDDTTRRALERAAVKFFWKACGMARATTRERDPVVALRACDGRDQANTLGGNASA